MTKICRRCNIDLSIEMFYKHPQMADGHLNVCINCKKLDSAKRIELKQHDPEWVEKEKARGREKYYRLGQKKPSYESKKNAIEKHKFLYPEKYKAKNASQRIPCPKGSERHHWNYNEDHFKDVIILERAVHSFLHRFMDYDQKAKIYRTSVKINQFKKDEPLDSKEKHLEFLKIIQEELW